MDNNRSIIGLKDMSCDIVKTIMNKRIYAFFIVLLLFLFSCENEPIADIYVEYTQPPSWLQGKWVDDPHDTQFEIEGTTSTVIISDPSQTLYDLLLLDRSYYMTVEESANSFVVTATDAGSPSMIFTFERLSSELIEFTLDHAEKSKDIGPLLFTPYIGSGGLEVQIVLPDSPIVLSLTSNLAVATSGTPVMIQADIVNQSYEWFMNGVRVTGQNGPQLEINTTEYPLEVGEYTIVCKLEKDGRVYFDTFILSIV